VIALVADRIFAAIEAGDAATVELPDGRTADLPACIGVKVSGDQLTRFDEYFDGTDGAAFD
jgi:hypothetical protein